METPYRFLTGIEDRAGNSAWRILEEITHYQYAGEGTVSPSTKWQWLDDSESDTHSEEHSVEPQLFHPSLNREDKEFKFEAPDQLGSYLEQHPRTKEQLRMLRKHTKPDTKVMVPPKLDGVLQTNKGWAI